MGSKTKQTQTNQPGWSAPPPTQATSALQGMVNQPSDYATPIRNQYARAEQNLNRSYNNPLGAYTTADVRDKSKREAHTDFQQMMGIDLSNAAQQENADRFNRQATVAGLTSPQFYNASSTGVQSSTPNWLGMGAGVGQAALM